MYLSSQDLLYIACAASLLAVGGFLSWNLYETARLLRQTNKLVEDTREKIERVEAFIEDISERVGSAAQYLGILAGAGKEVFGWMRERKQSDVDEETLPEELPKRKRKRS